MLMSTSSLSRINDVLYEIHRDIAADLPAAHLARVAAFSEQHFHRVFAAHMGESVHRYIARIRMEQAANQLMFDHSSKVVDIALKCGYKSLSSFTRTFKSRMGMSPGEWRKHHAISAEPDFMQVPEISAGYRRIATSPLAAPTIIETQPKRVAYMRHLGYNRNIQKTWQTLVLWAYEHQIEEKNQFALLHSNPALVPLDECRYVACIATDKPLLKRCKVNSLVIPGGLHARFHLCGIYGEFIPYLNRIMTEWAPSSGFKLKTTPTWVEYKKNQFMDEQGRFDLLLFLPVSFY